MQVTLIDSMGTDLSVVNAARVSFGKESEWVEREVTKSDAGYKGPDGLEVLYKENPLKS